jgi:hypothetical protein
VLLDGGKDDASETAAARLVGWRKSRDDRRLESHAILHGAGGGGADASARPSALDAAGGGAHRSALNHSG